MLSKTIVSSPGNLVELHTHPSKQALLDAYRGADLSTLRTPAFVVDRAVFAKNCARMHETALKWEANFRAHLKTHKTAEGARLQLSSNANTTHAVVVSTLMEAWQVLASGLIADGTVKDLLYGLPVNVRKIEELADYRAKLAEHGAIVRILIDHPDQIRALEKFEAEQEQPKRWSAFVKIDAGLGRAGVIPQSSNFKPFLTTVLKSSAVRVYGFYSHSGNAYGSTSLDEAASFLSAELRSVNLAAETALGLLEKEVDGAEHELPFTLSVGSTPTAHSASAVTLSRLQSVLHGKLELHAGNYPMLDLQQLHTSLITSERISQKVLATVVSYYPGRGVNGTDEAVCDAGAIAMSKDTGPAGDYGDVLGKPWRLGHASQEHGILVYAKTPFSGDGEPTLAVGEQVQIVGQHACLIAAAHAWYYIVDSDMEGGGNEVVDIWVSWKGW